MTVQQTTVERPARFLRVFLAASLLLSVLGCLWSIATPISGAPDEPAHLIKASSVVRGQFVGAYSPEGHIVEVPQYVGFTSYQACYARDESASAACIAEAPGDQNALVLATTTAGLYNPLYYLIVGWPSLLVPNEAGIYAMRMVSAIVVSLLLGTAFAAVSTWRRPALPLVGLIVALTPMVFFLNGTVNPNSMETAAVLATFATLLTIVRQPDHPRLVLLTGIVVASAAIAANMRGLSLLWLGFAVLTPFLFGTRKGLAALSRRRAVRIAIVITAVCCAFAALWVLASNSLLAGAVSSGAAPKTEGVGHSPLWGFSWTLQRTFFFAQEMIGVFGWLDTPAPLFVFFTWSLLAGGLFFMALVVARGKALWLVVGFIAAVVLLPAIIQGAYVTGGGIIWQGRYVLPLFTCAVFAAAVTLGDRVRLSDSAMRGLLVVSLALWGAAQFQSFAVVLRRYAVGLDLGWSALLRPEWAPPGGVPLVLFAYLVTLIASAVAAVLCLIRHESTLVEDPREPAPQMKTGRLSLPSDQ